MKQAEALAEAEDRPVLPDQDVKVGTRGFGSCQILSRRR